MEYLSIVLKCIVGLSILNVWLLRKGQSSPWRGGNANSLKEEFAHYGLSETAMKAVGTIKCLLAVGLLVSIFVPVLEFYSALGIAVMMVGAIAMHLKVGDVLKKSFPAFLFLALSVLIILI
ncbi:DoxX-like protein [Dokdonia sp. Hel_I_63]|uniref:DoxX family protein n=1 Tax=Dokdonia sp. Hel_I_63 TaxID=1249996 RepID=UPI00119B8330|nr:DoxX family protein [Dokdonia sp. Hel_I_63]TVZ23048.1 DoxX-like protein [Dokdonia sp. Hel_I_63]